MKRNSSDFDGQWEFCHPQQRIAKPVASVEVRPKWTECQLLAILCYVLLYGLQDIEAQENNTTMTYTKTSNKFYCNRLYYWLFTYSSGYRLCFIERQWRQQPAMNDDHCSLMFINSLVFSMMQQVRGREIEYLMKYIQWIRFRGCFTREPLPRCPLQLDLYYRLRIHCRFCK